MLSKNILCILIFYVIGKGIFNHRTLHQKEKHTSITYIYIMRVFCYCHLVIN